MQSRLLSMLTFVIIAFSTSTPLYAGTSSYICKYMLEATPKGISKQDKPFELRFMVDVNTKKAYAVGNSGSSEVELIPNMDSGVTFIEVTASGNVMVTAITKEGKTVHSRNGIMFNELVPSQFYGNCSMH